MKLAAHSMNRYWPGKLLGKLTVYYGSCCDGSAEGGDSDGDGCGGDDNH